MRFRAQYVPFFKHNTKEQLESLAESLIGVSIKIGVFGVKIGEITDAYVEDDKIFWIGEIPGSTQITTTGWNQEDHYTLPIRR